MGSVANTSQMPAEWKMAFVDAFAEFKEFTFVMRLEGEPPKTTAKNIIFSKWLPQKDLIGTVHRLTVTHSGHASTKLLITHGGYNSLTEATYTGVPLIVLPLFGDQVSQTRTSFTVDAVRQRGAREAGEDRRHTRQDGAHQGERGQGAPCCARR